MQTLGSMIVQGDAGNEHSLLRVAQGAFVVSHHLPNRITPLPSSGFGSRLVQETELEGGIVLGQCQGQVSKAGGG